MKEFSRAKIPTARFYAGRILPKARALSSIVKSGSQSTLALARNSSDRLT
jgi:hypothetical protein